MRAPTKTLPHSGNLYAALMPCPSPPLSALRPSWAEPIPLLAAFGRRGADPICHADGDLPGPSDSRRTRLCPGSADSGTGPPRRSRSPPPRPASRLPTSWPTSADLGIPPRWPETRRWQASPPSQRAPQPHGHPGACPRPAPPPPQGDDGGPAEQASYRTVSNCTCLFPFRSDGASRCRYRAAPGGQNREDATTIGKPLSGHTPPARHRQRTTPGQRPTLCNSDTPVRDVRSQARTRDSTPILPPVTASPPRNTEHAQPNSRNTLNLAPADRHAAHRSTSWIRLRHDRYGSSAAVCTMRQATNVPPFGPILSGWPSSSAARREHSRRAQTPQQDRGTDLAAEERRGPLPAPAPVHGRGPQRPSRVTFLSPTPSTHLDHKGPTCVNGSDLDHVDAKRRFRLPVPCGTQ